MVRLLNLDYSPAVQPMQLAEMERAAKGLGLALATMEAIGRSPALCRAFVLASRRSDRARLAFLAGVACDVAAPAAPVLAVAPA
jgi:hypothetical protein